MSDHQVQTRESRVPLSLLEPHMVKLPFVQWDRYISGTNYVSAFGWIPRPDGRADFVLLDQAEWAEEPNFWTSSARYSAEICRIIRGESTGHVDCQRVEDAGLSIPNVVRLKQEAQPAPAPVLPVEEMMANLRHLLVDVKAQASHARHQAEAIRSNQYAMADWKALQIQRWEGQAKWADTHGAALEQAIKVLEPSGEIMDRAFEKAARHILDLLVQREPLTSMRIGSLIGLEIAAREAGKAELARLLRESTQPAAAPVKEENSGA